MDAQSAYTVMLAKIRAHRHTTEVIARALKPHKVTVTEWLLLGAVSKQDHAVTTSELADELHVSLAMISRSTRQLEARLLIRIEKSKKDKRARAITLTKKGKELLQAAEPDVRAGLKTWLAPIAREHVEVYINVLMQVAYKL